MAYDAYEGASRICAIFDKYRDQKPEIPRQETAVIKPTSNGAEPFLEPYQRCMVHPELKPEPSGEVKPRQKIIID